MRVLIIEDEIRAANRLSELILKLRPTFSIEKVLESIDEAIKELKETRYDLIFMDIQLADGFSFEIFKSVKIDTPVIFATAYDNHAIDAFKVNGLDYILKPIKESELERSILKFEEHSKLFMNSTELVEILARIPKGNYKMRFMVKIGERFVFVKTEDISRFVSEDGYSFLITYEGKKYILDKTIEQLYMDLNPDDFFQINRKCIVCINSIDEINTYFNKRMKLTLKPSSEEDVIVSRPRKNEFKSWIDR